MKGKKFYFLLIGLILVGLGSIFLYRQQEEQRVLEFEGYEISTIENRVEALYNEEKTDIALEISEEELEELDTIFEELDEKKLSRRSREQIKELQLDFLIAREMLWTEEEVKDVFVKANVVKKEISEDEIDELEYDVLTFENLSDYVDRNIELLAYARQQIVAIDQATEFIENLFDEEENVLETVTREDEEHARELIESIRNEEVREELIAQIETVRLVLTEREEQLALEEEMEATEEQEEIEAVEELEEIEEEVEEAVEEPQYTAPPAQTWTPPVNSGTGGSTSETNGGTNGGNSESDNSGNTSDTEDSVNDENSKDDGEPTDTGDSNQKDDTSNGENLAGEEAPGNEEDGSTAADDGNDEEPEDGSENSDSEE